MSIVVRLENKSEREAENKLKLISFAVYRKLTDGAWPQTETLKRFGESLGMSHVQVENTLREAERREQNARLSEAIDKAIEIGDVNGAFTLMQRDYELNKIPRSKEESTHFQPVNAITIKDISSKIAQTARQTSISAIRGIRSWFRKIEQATRPTEQ